MHFNILQRLKDKLGTRQVPTAELLLDGTKAMLVSVTVSVVQTDSPRTAGGRGRSWCPWHLPHAHHHQAAQQHIISGGHEKVRVCVDRYTLPHGHHYCTDLLWVHLPLLYSRMLQLSRDYAGKRTAFKKPLTSHPLHMQTLARMEVSAITRAYAAVLCSQAHWDVTQYHYRA